MVAWRALLVQAAVGVGSATLVFVLMDARRIDATPPTRVEDDALASELARLRGEIDHLRLRGPTTPTQNSAPVSAADDDSENEADTTPEEAEASLTPAEAEQRLFVGLEQSFAAEVSDRSWSASTERAIHEAFASDELAGATLLDAACRSTMCRVRVSHESPETAEQFVKRIVTTKPFDTRGHIRNVGSEEAPEMVFYFERHAEQAGG